VLMAILIMLFVGAVAGWLAGLIMKGSGFGLLGDIGVGIVGGFIGGFLFRLVGLQTESILGAIISATAGAVVLLLVIRMFKKKS
jgi:uncharacterized membrane protein YeaQ/YmgE (transglycosylase-associated protein family)